MIKKALIISYHFPPFNVIASYRALAYAENLKKEGFEPYIVTHPFLPNGKVDLTVLDIKIEKEEKYTVIRVPIKNNYIVISILKLNRWPIIGKIITLLLNCLGFFDIHTLKSYYSLRSYLEFHLQKNKYDVIISIFSPQYQVRLPYELYNKFKTPYIIDFRDLWNNSTIHIDYNPTIKDKFLNCIITYYWSKWLSKALFFTITSNPWLSKMKSITNTAGHVITNGFEKKLFDPIIKQRVLNDPIRNSPKLIISHVGSLYVNQNLDIFLKGLFQFIKDFEPKIIINFIGIKKVSEINGNILTSYLPFAEEKIKTYIPEPYLKITETLPKSEVIKKMNDSHLLFFPGFDKSQGTYAGKIFEYLGIKRNIIVSPGDNSVVDDLIRETNAGYIANSSTEVYHLLKNIYNEWLIHGDIKYNGEDNLINKYSREFQVGQMVKLINKYLPR